MLLFLLFMAIAGIIVMIAGEDIMPGWAFFALAVYFFGIAVAIMVVWPA
jgi:hypothetical protein